VQTPARLVKPGEGDAIRSRSVAADQVLSRQNQWRLLIVGLIINDVLMTGLAFFLAYQARFYSAFPFFEQDIVPSFSFYQGLSLSLVLIWVGIFAVSGLYRRKNLLGGTQEYSLVFRATSTGMLLVVVAGFLEPAFILARGWLFIAWVMAFLFVSSGRFWIRRFVYALRRRGYFLSPALIIGANPEGRALAEQLLSWRTSGLEVLGFVDDNLPPGSLVFKHVQAVGRVNHLDHLIKKYNIEELIVATSAVTRNDVVAVFKKYGLIDGLNLRLSSGMFEIITTGLEVKEVAYTPLVRVQQARLTGTDRVLKFALDYVLTIPGLIVITPTLLLIALLIKLDSPGPVIYKRRVMGSNGRQFDAYKFRTMHVNGDQILSNYPELLKELAEKHKLKNDPRITRVGRILRKFSLDELPQLLNVVKRDMSLVGPRMISPAELAMYDEWGLNLLTVLPGITGLWQASGRSDVSYDERVRLDMHYIRNWTIWLDLQILLQTIPAVLFQRGAY
jgi:exopolysaccharide biosynthesis polyprenyl glycosylphosphotransferase